MNDLDNSILPSLGALTALRVCSSEKLNWKGLLLQQVKLIQLCCLQYQYRSIVKEVVYDAFNHVIQNWTLWCIQLYYYHLMDSSPFFFCAFFGTESANLRNLEMLDLSYCYLNSQPESLQMVGMFKPILLVFLPLMLYNLINY